MICDKTENVQIKFYRTIFNMNLNFKEFTNYDNDKE